MKKKKFYKILLNDDKTIGVLYAPIGTDSRFGEELLPVIGYNDMEFTLKYQNGLLVHSEKFDLNRNEKEITHFEYCPNGRLKRRKIERESEPELKGHYAGGPGSDDEFYELINSSMREYAFIVNPYHQ